MHIRTLVAGTIVGFIDAILIGNIMTVFSTNTAGVIIFLLSWLALSYVLYQRSNIRTLAGSLILVLGLIALLVPLGLVAVGSRMGGFGPLAGILGAVAFGLILGPLGLILTFIGFWLINQGLRRQRIESPAMAGATIASISRQKGVLSRVEPRAEAQVTFRNEPVVEQTLQPQKVRKCRYCTAEVPKETVICSQCGIPAGYL
jgi:hypothetical protein